MTEAREKTRIEAPRDTLAYFSDAAYDFLLEFSNEASRGPDANTFDMNMFLQFVFQAHQDNSEYRETELRRWLQDIGGFTEEQARDWSFLYATCRMDILPLYDNFLGVTRLPPP